MIIRTIFNYSSVEDSPRRCESVTDTRSLTVPDCVTRIGDLIVAYNGRINDLLEAQNNGLLFESAGKKYWHDELDPKDVARVKELQDNEAKIAAAKAENDRLFDEFKAMMAAKKTVEPPTPPVSE